jgi:hypothetical protein
LRTSQPGESALLLLDAIDVLEGAKISYAVIGAIAASLHGAVRASMDADIVISLAAQQADALEQACKKASFETQLRWGDFDDPIPALLQLSDRYGNRVDLLIGLRGIDSAAFSRTVSVPFQGRELKFIGREDFIAMKVFAGGPVDMLDASRALAASETLDEPLLRRLAKGYGREATEKLEQLLGSRA